MQRVIQNAHRWLAGVILLALPCAAQMQVGDNLHMSMSGDLGVSYAGGNDQGLSDHSLGFSGDGTLTGNYYSPNFLNFNVDPFYNRAQTNSVFGSLTNTTGVTSNVNLFNGSHFPGTVSYNRLFNATSQFGVPGSEIGLAQHTNTQGFGIGWSALVPDWPTLIANYSVNNNSNSIIGLEGQNDETDHTLNLVSQYRWNGYQMTGQFIHRNVDADFSQIVGQLVPVQTESSSNTYAATVQHSLPLAGMFGVTWNHLNYDYDYTDSYSAKSSGGSTTVNGIASFHPTSKLGVAFNANYNDSLLGSVPEGVLNNGAVLNMATLGSFKSELVGSDVYYQLFKYLGVHADVSHIHQSFLGQTYSATQFFGSANFNFDHSLLKGLSFSVGAVNTVQQTDNTGVGFVGTVNYTRKHWGWDFNANFSYAQNVQTVMLVYTTSSLTYLGSARRRLSERTYFMAGYSGAHSGITANSGSTSRADRVWTTFMHRGYTLNTFFNRSSGEAVLTSNGLVPVPGNVPPPVLLGALTSYDSQGWGLNAGATPIRQLTVSAGFSKSNGHTVDPLVTTATNTELINVVAQYRLRKVFLNGGYTRLSQSIGTVGTQPIDITTYFIGFSRWFNFF
ncbi:MAG TPA: hypothetical protein VMS18_20530 [Candidatus Binatia bacterium]|nr:hypothetical protein [Candidatus Binatia bacterium]